MEQKQDILSKLLSTKTSGLVTSINDLRDKEFSGHKLSAEERFALSNFDRYRINILNSQEDEVKFHNQYRKLQVIANLTDWHEFLKEDFSK
ncbi:MAG: hypothetical protein H0W61_05330 [Bacteroidetes bacterium]|nr:hypothetical protein [Bacteroidota bacterium]